MKLIMKKLIQHLATTEIVMAIVFGLYVGFLMGYYFGEKAGIEHMRRLIKEENVIYPEAIRLQNMIVTNDRHLLIGIYGSQIDPKPIKSRAGQNDPWWWQYVDSLKGETLFISQPIMMEGHDTLDITNPETGEPFYIYRTCQAR